MIAEPHNELTPPPASAQHAALGTLIVSYAAGVCITLAAVLWVSRLTEWAGAALVGALFLAAYAVASSRRLHSMAFIFLVLGFGASAFFFPQLYVWSWRGWEPKLAIVPLIQVTMFGMGVTLTFEDFARVMKMPRAIVIGIVCQYSVMPLMAWLFAYVFDLPPTVAAGLILIGSCPGGVTSNVIAYIARANVPLSVTMTACSTLISPLMTPLMMKLVAGQYVPIPFGSMVVSIFTMILVPVLLGLLANHFAPVLVRKCSRVLPALAMFAICFIIAITVALARDDLVKVGLALFAAAACHNAAGYLLGYRAARLLGLNARDSRTVAIEVGIQNGGMATGLALNVMKSPVAALGSAVFGPWSALTSAVLASYWHDSIPDDEPQLAAAQPNAVAAKSESD